MFKNPLNKSQKKMSSYLSNKIFVYVFGVELLSNF